MKRNTEKVYFESDVCIMKPMPTHPLRAFRDARHMTQSQFAEKIGVHSLSVSRWETGQRKIDLDLVAQISKITGIPKRKLRPDLAAMFD
jgi:transcriptional regulator with XRE-family HTH domain